MKSIQLLWQKYTLVILVGIICFWIGFGFYAFEIMPVKETINFIYFFSPKNAGEFWTAIAAIGTICVTWFAAKTTRDIAKKGELSQKEEALAKAKFLARSLYPSIIEIKAFIDILYSQLQNINKIEGSNSSKLTSIFNYLKQIQKIKILSIEHVIILTPLPNKIGSELYQTLTILSQLYRIDDPINLPDVLLLDIIQHIKSNIFFVKEKLDTLIPELFKESN